MEKIFHNSSLIDKDKFCISIDDRMFRFGDGLFETIKIINGKAFLFDAHVERLTQGLKALKIEIDLKSITIQSEKLIEINQVRDGILRLFVSRGSSSKGYLPNKKNCNAYYLITAESYEFPEIKNCDLMISSWEKPSANSYPANYKTANSLSSVLAKMEADENNVYDSIQCDKDGFIIECSSSNIVFLKGNIVYYPKDSGESLEGITLSVFRVITSFLKSVTKRIHNTELDNYDEAFIMNTAIGILPVHEIKNNVIFKEKNAKLFRDLYYKYQLSSTSGAD